MVKCDICGAKIEEMYLGKIKGSYIKKNGKLKTICFECQRKFRTKEEILNNL